MYLEGKAHNSPSKWPLTVMALFIWPFIGLVTFFASRVLDIATRSGAHTDGTDDSIYYNHNGAVGWITLLVFWILTNVVLFLFYRYARVERPTLQVIKTVTMIVGGFLAELPISLFLLFASAAGLEALGVEPSLTVIWLIYIPLSLSLSTALTFYTRSLFTQRQIRAARIAQEEPRA